MNLVLYLNWAYQYIFYFDVSDAMLKKKWIFVSFLLGNYKINIIIVYRFVSIPNLIDYLLHFDAIC